MQQSNGCNSECLRSDFVSKHSDALIPPGSNGVWAKCPVCHHAILHGFQVCDKCGHALSAKEQQSVRNALKINVLRFSIVAVVVFFIAMYIVYT